jgi:hypothetical protein
MLRRSLFSAYGAVERVHHLLNFDKFVPRSFRRVAIEGSGEHLGMCIAILQHAIPGFLQRIEPIAHFWPSLPTSMGDASIVKHEAEARIQSCECTSVLSE